MKFYRIYCLFLNIIIVASLMTGCRLSFSMEQSIEAVESVEICKYDYKSDSMYPIASLNEKEYTELLNEISEMKRNPLPFDMPPGYGILVVHITYKDQAEEIIGNLRRDYLVDGEVIDFAVTNFRGDFNSLLSKYVDVDQKPVDNPIECQNSTGDGLREP